MFTINDSHAQSVGWIASRHVVLATLFAMLAVLLHVRSRAQRSLGLQAASLASTALTLLSAEFGVAALAYLTAYACVFEAGRSLRASRRSRRTSGWPRYGSPSTWRSAAACVTQRGTAIQ